MNVDRLVEQARELRPAATGEAAYQFLSEAPGLLAGLADAVERLEAERDEAIDAHDTLIDEQRPLLTEVSDLEARVAALEAGIAEHRDEGARMKPGSVPFASHDAALWALLDGRVRNARKIREAQEMIDNARGQ